MQTYNILRNRSKATIVNVLLAVLLGLSFWASFAIISEGAHRTAPHDRQVTLVDTSLDKTFKVSRKGDRTYNDLDQWIVSLKGHFIDQKTGKTFTTTINNKLSYEFEAGVGKPIPMTLSIRGDMLDGDFWGGAYPVLGSMLFFITLFASICYLVYLFTMQHIWDKVRYTPTNNYFENKRVY